MVYKGFGGPSGSVAGEGGDLWLEPGIILYFSFYQAVAVGRYRAFGNSIPLIIIFAPAGTWYQRNDPVPFPLSKEFSSFITEPPPEGT